MFLAQGMLSVRQRVLTGDERITENLCRVSVSLLRFCSPRLLVSPCVKVIYGWLGPFHTTFFAASWCFANFQPPHPEDVAIAAERAERRRFNGYDDDGDSSSDDFDYDPYARRAW